MSSKALISGIKNAIFFLQPARSYAVKSANPAILALGKKGKKAALGAAATSAKTEMIVETDTHKLVNYVCGSNIFKEGEDVQIKPDSEYPDWLWTVRTGPPKALEEMEVGTKEYYEALKEYNIGKRIRLSKYSKRSPF